MYPRWRFIYMQIMIIYIWQGYKSSVDFWNTDEICLVEVR